MRGLPQENYSLSMSVDFHAYGLPVMLSVAKQIVVLPSGCLPICHERIRRTTDLLNRKRLVPPEYLGYRPSDFLCFVVVAVLTPQGFCILIQLVIVGE